MVEVCESLIQPAIETGDPDLTLLAIECIGLVTMLDKEVFTNYSSIYISILKNSSTQQSEQELRSKLIALKSAIDGLMVHGVCDESTQELFDLITRNYMQGNDPYLRQITIEGVCKMMFNNKLCDDCDPAQSEAIISALLVQLFDKKFNSQNSLVRSILSFFFENFVLVSSKRCDMVLNAVTKLAYASIMAKHRPNKAVKEKKKKQVKHRDTSSEESERSESDFYEADGYDSADSRIQASKTMMGQILSDLDLQTLVPVTMALLSKSYINNNGMYKLTEEKSVQLLYRLLMVLQLKLKKVQTFKECIVPLLDYIAVSQCDSLTHLQLVKNLWDQESARVVSWNAKMSKFQERICLRLIELEEIEESNMIKEEQKTTDLL